MDKEIPKEQLCTNPDNPPHRRMSNFKDCLYCETFARGYNAGRNAMYDEINEAHSMWDE